MSSIEDKTVEGLSLILRFKPENQCFHKNFKIFKQM